MATYEDYKEVMDRNYGTNVYHSNMFDSNFYYTDGIEDFAKTMSAYWLIDMVESYTSTVREFLVENEMDSDTMFVNLNVSNNEAEFSIYGYTYIEEDDDEEVSEDAGKAIMASQHIPFTDLPEGKYEFFLGRQGMNELVFFLTSEY